MERRHALVSGDGIETARIGLSRQGQRQLGTYLRVNAKQIGHGVRILEPGQPAQCPPLLASGNQARLGESLPKGAKGRFDRRGFGPWSR